MRYRVLGTSGLRVSELFLGAMTFAEGFAHGADADEARRIVDAYADAGGNVVDTAFDIGFPNEFIRDMQSFVYGEVGARVDKGHRRPDDPPPSGHSASQTAIWSPTFSISRMWVTRSTFPASRPTVGAWWDSAQAESVAVPTTPVPPQRCG